MILNRFSLRDINPLRGLDERRLASVLDYGERGAYAEVQWLYRFIEKRNPTARAVKRRLLSALGKLEWNIKTVDCDGDKQKKALADQQAATLRTAYDRVKGLHRALVHLALADLRGFSHVEKRYRGEGETAWDIIELRPVEQWFWVRDGLYGAWQYNAEARTGTFQGAPIDERQFVVREVDDPANEIIAKLHVRQEVSDSDWDGYLERFGIPTVLIEGPPNVPPEKEAEYQRQAERIASDASGYIPNGAKAHTVSAGSGSSVFRERLEYLDGQIVIAGTSGKLTILSESGSGTLAGNAQKDAFDEVAQAIASSINQTMQDAFDKEILERAFPDQEPLAYFEFASVDEEKAGDLLDDAVKAKQAGLEMDPEEMSERSGYKLTRAVVPVPGGGSSRTNEIPIHQEGAATQQAPTPSTSPDGQTRAGTQPAQAAAPAQAMPPDAAAMNAQLSTSLRVTPEYLAPAAAVVDRLIADASDGSVSNEELIARAQQMLAALPDLAGKMDATGIADAMAQALRTTVESTLKGA